MTKEVATREDAAIEAAIRDGVALPEVEEPEEVAKAIVSRILSAPDVESVFATFEATPGKELLGVPLLIRGVRWQRSSFEQGPVLYALLDAVRGDTGEGVTVTTSGRSVMAALYRFGELGAYPVKAKLEEARNPTPEGYKPLRLLKA